MTCTERFTMNHITWTISCVRNNSPLLVDRTGKHTVATTDTRTKCIYLSEELYGPFLKRVLLHELGHCALYSYGLLDDIHRMVPPNYWIEIEELICNIIADYGDNIYNTLYSVYGLNTWKKIPEYLGGTLC